MAASQIGSLLTGEQIDGCTASGDDVDWWSDFVAVFFGNGCSGLSRTRSEVSVDNERLSGGGGVAKGGLDRPDNI